MVKENRLEKILKEKSVHYIVNEDYFNSEDPKEIQSYYQRKNLVSGHWGHDWLTDWQTKNES